MGFNDFYKSALNTSLISDCGALGQNLYSDLALLQHSIGPVIALPLLSLFQPRKVVKRTSVFPTVPLSHVANLAAAG